MPDDAAADTITLWDRQREVFGELKIVQRTCPLCGDANAATPASRYSLDNWTVKTCRTCGFTYMTTAPHYDALFEQMSWEKSSDLESERRRTTRAVQQVLSKKTRWRLHLLPRKRMPALLARYAAPGNVIDLGCGGGDQLDGLPEAYVPYGIEISKQTAIRADRRFAARGGAVVNAACLDGLQAFPAEHFSAASLRSYLEHEMRPAAVLRALHRVLRPGGIAIIKVPNFASLNRQVMGRSWCGFRYPDHLNYFTPATLRAMAARCGYRASFGATWRLPTSDNMWALLRKSSAAAWLFAVHGLGLAHIVAEAGHVL